MIRENTLRNKGIYAMQHHDDVVGFPVPVDDTARYSAGLDEPHRRVTALCQLVEVEDAQTNFA